MKSHVGELIVTDNQGLVSPRHLLLIDSVRNGREQIFHVPRESPTIQETQKSCRMHSVRRHLVTVDSTSCDSYEQLVM